MKPEIQIADFLRYNAQALNEMKNESPEIASAFAQVIKELAQKYGNIGPIAGTLQPKIKFTKSDYQTLTGNFYRWDEKNYYVKRVIFKPGFLPNEFTAHLVLKEFVRGSKKATKEEELLLTNVESAFFELSAFRWYTTFEDEAEKNSNYRFMTKARSIHIALKQYYHIYLENLGNKKIINLHYEGKTVTEDLCLFRFAQIVNGEVIEEKQYMSAEQCAEMLLNNDLTINSPSKGINLAVRPKNYWLSVLLRFNLTEINPKIDLIGLQVKRWNIIEDYTIGSITKNAPKNKVFEIYDAKGEKYEQRISMDDINNSLSRIASTHNQVVRPAGQTYKFLSNAVRFMTYNEFETRYESIENGKNVLSGLAESERFLKELELGGLTFEDFMEVVQNKTINQLGEEGSLFFVLGGELRPAIGGKLFEGYDFRIKDFSKNVTYKITNSFLQRITTLETKIPDSQLENYVIDYDWNETQLDLKTGFARRTLNDNLYNPAPSYPDAKYQLCVANRILSVDLSNEEITYEYTPEGFDRTPVQQQMSFNTYMMYYLYLDYSRYTSEPLFFVGNEYPIVVESKTVDCQIIFRTARGGLGWDYKVSYQSPSTGVQVEDNIDGYYLERRFNPNRLQVGDKIQINETFKTTQSVTYNQMNTPYLVIKEIRMWGYSSAPTIIVETSEGSQITLDRTEGLYLKDLQLF